MLTSSTRRFEKIIVSAYAWLANNYENGDRIFLFGEYLKSDATRTVLTSVQGLLAVHIKPERWPL